MSARIPGEQRQAVLLVGEPLENVENPGSGALDSVLRLRDAVSTSSRRKNVGDL